MLNCTGNLSLTHWPPRTSCKKCDFWTFWCFLSWISAQLNLIWSKMRLKHYSLPFLAPVSPGMCRHQNFEIRASLEKSFPPAEVEYRWCQIWWKVMTSEVEERPRYVTGDYGRHRNQWVNLQMSLLLHWAPKVVETLLKNDTFRF